MDNSSTSAPLSDNPFNIPAPVPHLSPQANPNNSSSSNSTPDFSTNKTPEDDPLINPANADNHNNDEEEETIVTTSNKKPHSAVDHDMNSMDRFSSKIYNKIRRLENNVDENIK